MYIDGKKTMQLPQDNRQRDKNTAKKINVWATRTPQQNKDVPVG